ncbi:MAG: hypothetical protein RMJ83_09905 [Armatimonadota bacterium]|nr:hypothetical protein [Armatimonadota bacterium]
MRRYDIKQIAEALRKAIEHIRCHHQYPELQVNAAYLVYDICQQLHIPEPEISRILGYRGYLYVAKTRYYATPEGVAALEEALNAIADPFTDDETEEADDE